MKKHVLTSIKSIIVILTFFLAAANVQASHYVGSDITFTYTGNPGYYQLRLKVYRDCGGITFGNNITLSGSSSCGTATASLMLVTSSDVSEVCATQLTECSGNNAVPGVQLWVYEGIVQLSPCANWQFYYTGNARNDGIVNLNNGNTDILDWWTNAGINTTGAINNNSPLLSATPVPYVCLQDTVNYNLQATDPDSDSLVFSLVSARAAGGITITYTPGYSATQPFGTPAAVPANPFPTTINPQTGQLTFRAMSIAPYVVVIKVEEWRYINGIPTLVGFVHRDVQVQVMQCTTPAPELGQLTLLQNNVPLSTFSFDQVPQLNACEPYCIQIPATSLGAGVMVNLSITSNTANEIPGSTFTVLNQNTANPVGMLCFTPDPALAGQTFFYTVGISDNVCPIPNDFIKALQVHVVKNTGFSVQSSGTSVCAGDSVQLSAQALPGTVSLTSGAYTSFSWTAVDATNGQPVAGQFQGGQNTSAQLNPVAAPTQSVKYILAGNTTNGCTDSAEVLVSVTGIQPQVISISAPFTTLMQAQTATISAVVQGPAGIPNPGFVYSWSPAAGLSSATVLNPVVSFAGQSTVTYTLMATNGTCSHSGVITFSFIPNAAPIAGFDIDLTGCCQVGINSTAIGGNTYSYNFGDGSAASSLVNPTHTYTTSGTYTITQTVTNSLGTDVANRTVSVLVSASEEILAKQVSLYPNPTSGSFYLDLSAITTSETVSVEIYNLLGQILINQSVETGRAAEFDLKNLSDDSYLVRVKLNDMVITKDLQVQR